jgi:hypothetical protein
MNSYFSDLLSQILTTVDGALLKVIKSYILIAEFILLFRAQKMFSVHVEVWNSAS